MQGPSKGAVLADLEEDSAGNQNYKPTVTKQCQNSRAGFGHQKSRNGVHDGAGYTALRDSRHYSTDDALNFT
jgi:hypothetical protein